MIKVILILSAVMMIATAIFGVLNRQNFLAERDLKEKTKGQWAIVNKTLGQTEDTLQDTQEELKTAKDDRDERDAKKTLAKEKLMQKERAVKELEQTLSEQDAKLKEFQLVLDKTGSVSIEDLGNKRDKMKQDITNGEAELVTLTENLAKANEAVDAGERTLDGHVQNQVDRKAAIRRNGFTATVTAVNTDWGFAIINAGANVGVSPDSALLVKNAAGERLGRLTIISVERNVTVADIESSNLTGQILPGHRVIYEKVAE